MTQQKLLIKLACLSMGTASLVFLTGCSTTEGAGRTTGPHPVDSYTLAQDPKDANTVALTILPDGHREHAEAVQPVNLHFKVAGHANAIKVRIVEREGKQPKLVIEPQTTGPHPIIVSIDSASQ